MKEHPILFSAPMVRALLDGRKTQTRRPYKIRKHPDAGCEIAASELVREPQHVIDRICPFGQPGDRLWVRETWAEVGTMDPGLIVYRADYPACVPRQYENVPSAESITWKPSIHMFRKDSRILLEVVSVRVERLNNISAADAIAEGVHQTPDCGPEEWAVENLDYLGHSPQESYCELIEDINGTGTWNANPWVWAVEFKMLHGKEPTK